MVPFPKTGRAWLRVLMGAAEGLRKGTVGGYADELGATELAYVEERRAEVVELQIEARRYRRTEWPTMSGDTSVEMVSISGH